MDNQTESQREGAIMPSLPRISGGWAIFILFWPFAALIKALYRFREPFSKTVFWGFCIYFGFVFVYEDPELKKFSADSATYVAKLLELHDNPHSFDALFESFYNKKEGVVDIYQPLITWLISLITGDPRILFAVFAAVFGFFYTQNLWIVFNFVNKQVGLILILFMLVFAGLNPIWNINGVRMYTAAHIFLYGILKFFLFNDRKGLIWSTSSILVHFSFLFPVTILIGWFLFPKKDFLFIAFYFLTAFLLEIQLPQVRNFLSFLPDFFQPRVLGYTDQNYAEEFVKLRSSYSWHFLLQQKISVWIVYLWILAVYFWRRKWAPYFPKLHKFFMFALFLGGFANLATHVPAGSRFLLVSNSFFYAIFIILLGSVKTEFNPKFLKLFSIPFLIFLVIFDIRIGFSYTGFLTYVGNPIIAPFLSNQTPLIDYVKGLL